MKKAFRIIVPLVLILAILVSTIWYLFVYDRAITQDILLKAARYFENNGNLSASAWFYNHAYKQSGDNDAVAIELSNQYRSSGNYTKAEYTLTSAIADGGGVDLYIALSKLYVEQDKLLDAVRMISNITNKNIKAQLEQLRPAAPTCTPDPLVAGSHQTQYITVNISAESGKLYANNNGLFPSVETDLYNNQGFTLHDGENTIYAISVGENGLVSPVSIFAFTVGGVVKKVEFADSVMEAAFREKLNFSNSKPIYTSDLWTILDFTVPAEARNLDDLQHLVFLKTLTINEGPSGELEHIAKLPNLEELTITNTTVLAEELSHIGRLESLKKLTLQKCGLSTVAGLEQAKRLTHLDLSDNSLRNIMPLSELQNLLELDLSNNALNDLLALSGLKNITILDVSHNEIASLIPISTISGLEKLDVSNNLLTELTGVAQLSQLGQLNASGNAITVISALSANTELTLLNISDNKIVDISSLSSLNKLANLNFSNNQVTALPTWDIECGLVHINGSNNLIRSLDPLKGLKLLNNVYMDDNANISSVQVLKDCPLLIQVNVSRTKVTKASQVKVLEDMGVIVIFDKKG